MKKLIISLFVAMYLVGCGGGGGGGPETQATPTPTPSATTTSPPAATTAPQTAPSVPVISAPALDLRAMVVTGPTTTLSGCCINAVIQAPGTSNLTLNANSTNIWISTGQTMGAVVLGGVGNTVVFEPGSTVGSLMITGATNTVYLPIGSPIVADGAGVASAAIKFYTP